MSLFAGLSSLAISLLLLRALKIWYQNHESMGKFADEMIINLLLPLIIGALVFGAGMSIASVWSGTSWPDAGAAILAATAFVLAWRRLGALPRRTTVVPFTPKPDTTHSGYSAHARSNKKAA